MGWLKTAPAFLLLAACGASSHGAGSQASARPAPRGADWSVSYSLNSWGRPIAYWQVLGDGTGEIWRLPELRPFAPYEVRKYHMRLPESAMTQLAAALDQIQSATRKPPKCALTITDLAYGSMVWKNAGAVQTYEFNFGCNSKGADLVYTRLGEANDLVQASAIVEPQPFAVEHAGDR